MASSLSCDGIKPYEVLRGLMKYVYVVLIVPLYRLLEALEDLGEDIFQILHLERCNTSSSLRQMAELSISQHDWLNLQDISHFLENGL